MVIKSFKEALVGPGRYGVSSPHIHQVYMKIYKGKHIYSFKVDLTSGLVKVRWEGGRLHLILCEFRKEQLRIDIYIYIYIVPTVGDTYCLLSFLSMEMRNSVLKNSYGWFEQWFVILHAKAASFRWVCIVLGGRASSGTINSLVQDLVVFFRFLRGDCAKY